MDISTYLANKWLDMLGGTAFTAPSGVYLSAHSGEPGLTGTNEVGTAGSNGYTRPQIEFNAASSKSIANTNQEQITMPNNLASNTLVSYLGLWDAATAGNFLTRIPLLGTPLEATVTTADVFETGVAHGYSAGERVTLVDAAGGSLPTGLSAGTLYYVRTSGLTSTQFTISATGAGDAAVDVTAAGGVIVRRHLAQPFNASNILQVAAGAVVISL